MQTKLLMIVSAALLLGGCMGPVRQAQTQQLTAAEIQSLFSDKTVESVSRSGNTTSFTYYHPDGRVLQQRLWSLRSGHWKVTDDAKICLSFAKTRCRAIQVDDGTYYKVKQSKGKPAEKVVRYRRFAEGNHLLPAGQAWPELAHFRP